MFLRGEEKQQFGLSEDMKYKYADEEFISEADLESEEEIDELLELYGLKMDI